jgi:hypothetical protein
MELCYWSLYFRFLDLLDTFFFVANKKFGHITNLHVVHHFLIPIYGWILTRFVPGGNDCFAGFLNFFVHVIMYTYYFLASLGPGFKKYLWWKKYLTRLQLVQFVLAICKTLPNVMGWTHCAYPWQFSVLTLGFFGFMLVMFAQFYVSEYVKPKRKVN